MLIQENYIIVPLTRQLEKEYTNEKLLVCIIKQQVPAADERTAQTCSDVCSNEGEVFDCRND